jgi:hypothetical protein
MPRGRTGVVPVSVPVRYAEQGFAGDGLQPTLRFGFQPRLKPGVRLPHNPWRSKQSVDEMTKTRKIDAETQRAIGRWDAEARQTVHVKG